MINKILSKIRKGQNKPHRAQYKHPDEIPWEEHCENCAYQNTEICTGINCFTGIMEKLKGEK